ncbi:MAG: N-acetylmuramoyl-L-alanine amidase [Bacteroidales bacterium]|nr:N-acetylmuramoyl-L-alanine amidase [Bacteroidales bacterium]
MKYVSFLILLLLSLTAGAQTKSGQKTAEPNAGEGLDAFLLRNGYNVQLYKPAFIELNKKHLGKNNSLLSGVKYVFPEKENVAYEPLLGEKNAKVNIESSELKGATFYLVSGHGGPDPGAMGNYDKHDLYEDEYAYDIMLRTARKMLSKGANVHIIIQDPDDGIRDDAYLSYDDHETCCGKAIPLDQNQRLQQRSDAINDFYTKERKGYCRSIFFHLDSRSTEKRIDVFFYHYTKSVKGERLARSLRDKFDAKYKQHQPNRGFNGTVSERQLYVLKATNPPAVFLELGNIQNSQDLQRFNKVDNREALANWITEGCVDDFKKGK